MTQPVLTLNDGVAIPQIGLGVWQIEDGEAPELVSNAIDLGYRHVDTARVYGNERGVGEAIRRAQVARSDVFVTTKVWNDDQGYDNTLRAFDESIARLGLDEIDLYLIHWAKPSQDKYLETWKALIEIKNSGRVRSIGVSNFQIPHLERIIGETGVLPSVNQIELHPRFQQHDLRAFHKARGIATESWSPLGAGTLLNDSVLDGIGRKHGKSIAQVIIRWHIQNGLIVIPKSANPKRMAENLAVFDFALDDEDLVTIGKLDSPEGRTGGHPDHVAW